MRPGFVLSPMSLSHGIPAGHNILCRAPAVSAGGQPHFFGDCLFRAASPKHGPCKKSRCFQSSICVRGGDFNGQDFFPTPPPPHSTSCSRLGGADPSLPSQ